MQKAVSFNDVDVVYVKGNAYKIHFWYMSADNAINTVNNATLIEKWLFYNFFLSHIK